MNERIYSYTVSISPKRQAELAAFTYFSFNKHSAPSCILQGAAYLSQFALHSLTKGLQDPSVFFSVFSGMRDTLLSR